MYKSAVFRSVIALVKHDNIFKFFIFFDWSVAENLQCAENIAVLFDRQIFVGRDVKFNALFGFAQSFFITFGLNFERGNVITAQNFDFNIFVCLKLYKIRFNRGCTAVTAPVKLVCHAFGRNGIRLAVGAKRNENVKLFTVRKNLPFVRQYRTVRRFFYIYHKIRPLFCFPVIQTVVFNICYFNRRKLYCKRHFPFARKLYRNF